MRTIQDIFGDTKLTPELLIEFKHKSMNDLSYWCTKVLGYPLDDPMHKTWSDSLNEKSKICIQGFRESFKSSMMLVGYATRDMYFGKQRRGLIYGHTKPQACEKIDRIVETCLDNELLAPLIPGGNRDRESKAELRKQGCYSITAIGIGAPARGKHVHWIIVDDPFEDKMRFTHKSIKDYFFRTISNMIMTGKYCHLILIATPQNKTDLLHDTRIKESDEWAYLRYPAILNYETKKVSWPEQWSFEQLMRRKEDIGELEFEQEFQLNPLDSSQGQMFPAEILTGDCLDYAEHYHYSLMKHNLVLTVDPSFGTRDNCVFLIGYQENGILNIIHIDVLINMDDEKFINKIIEKYTRFKIKRTYIEKNSLQAILKRINSLPYHIHLFPMTRELKLEMFKIILCNRFHRGNIKFPYMTKHDEEITNKILLELNNLGFDKTQKLRAMHGKDDMAMALGMLSYFTMKNIIETHTYSGTPSYDKIDYMQDSMFSEVPRY